MCDIFLLIPEEVGKKPGHFGTPITFNYLLVSTPVFGK